MNSLEIFFGFSIYSLIIYLWNSNLFWGKYIHGEEAWFGLNDDRKGSKYLHLLNILIPAFLTSFCFYKIVEYGAINEYYASALVWAGFFVPVSTYFLFSEKINKMEFILNISGFFVALIGLASFYTIF